MQALFEMAGIYKGRAEYSKALELLTKSRDLAARLADSAYRGWVINSMGQSYEFSQRYPEALERSKTSSPSQAAQGPQSRSNRP